MAAFSPDAVPAGSKAFGHVPVVDSLAVSTSLPVGVIRSAHDGPTLAVTAGLFPSEYAGIEAASRLYAQTEPADLCCGTLLILPCVNLQGFQFRTPWLNVKHTAAAPFDGLNVNASFPGSSAANAPLSSQQAAACFGVVNGATAHIDFRGGDLSESHLVHTIYPQLHDDPELDRQRMEIALSFGLQYNLSASPSDAHSQGGAGDGSCMGELLKLGCLSFVSECGLGYLTQPREEFILNHVNGTRNVLRYLGMMRGVPRYQHAKHGPQRFLLNPFIKAHAPESVSTTCSKLS
jgi:predicted deacylase